MSIKYLTVLVVAFLRKGCFLKGTSIFVNDSPLKMCIFFGLSSTCTTGDVKGISIRHWRVR